MKTLIPNLTLMRRNDKLRMGSVRWSWQLAALVLMNDNQSRNTSCESYTMSADPAQLNPSSAASDAVSSDAEQEWTPLLDKWVLYAHLPNDMSWTLDSYRHVLGFNALQEGVALARGLPDITIKKCMFFLMRSHVEPRWEDPLNKDGGSFSFKVASRQVVQGWRNLMYCAIGETLFDSEALNKKVTGVTISPKKSFSIIKVWLRDCEHQDPISLNPIPGLLHEGCIFKRHIT